MPRVRTPRESHAGLSTVAEEINLWLTALTAEALGL